MAGALPDRQENPQSPEESGRQQGTACQITGIISRIIHWLTDGVYQADIPCLITCTC